MRAKHVIFRSKGCRTCRARKVKCDETRPICERCARSRFKCQGYSEPTSFLFDNPQVQRSSLVISANSVRAFQTGPLSSVPQPLPYPAELTYNAFLVRRLCIGTPGDRRGFSWLRPGLESSDQNSLFYIASRCLAEIYYGRVFNQEGVVTTGMAKYVSIIRQLWQKLQSPGFFHSCNLVSVIMTSVVIESIASQSAAGHHAHIRGLSQLVQTAGPGAFMHRPNVLIFELCRCWIIGRAIMGKHETFVADPEWKTIPWTYEKKAILTQLWDVIGDIPSLTFNITCLQYSKGEATSQAPVGSLSPLHLQFISVLQNLFTWRWNWELQHSGSAEEVPVVTSDLVTDECGKPWYSTIILYPSRHRAVEIIYYNATLIYLFRMARRLQWNYLIRSTDRTVPPETAQPLPYTPLLLPSDTNTLENASSEFYRSIDGCLSFQPKYAGEGYQLMFALSLVNAGLDQASLEAAWMRRIRTKIIATSGLDMWSAARRSI